LLEKTTDCWPTACRQMKALLADEKGLDTTENRALVKSLEAALAPSKSKPGSVEALIDDLVNAHYTQFGGERDAPTLRLMDLGFDAVPALLEHLTDQRLTHYLYVSSFGGNWTPPRYQSRVGDLASGIIWKIAGGDYLSSGPTGPINVADEKRKI